MALVHKAVDLHKSQQKTSPALASKQASITHLRSLLWCSGTLPSSQRHRFTSALHWP